MLTVLAPHGMSIAISAPWPIRMKCRGGVCPVDKGRFLFPSEHVKRRPDPAITDEALEHPRFNVETFTPFDSGGELCSGRFERVVLDPPLVLVAYGEDRVSSESDPDCTSMRPARYAQPQPESKSLQDLEGELGEPPIGLFRVFVDTDEDAM